MTQRRIYIDPSMGSFFWPNHLVAVALRDQSNSQIVESPLAKCDLAVYGPYTQQKSLIGRVRGRVEKSLRLRRYSPIKMFMSIENVRPDLDRYDFCIGGDFGVVSDRFLRLPYWMHVLDWPCLVQKKITYSRFGALLSIDRLMRPLGNSFLSRNGRASLICRHLQEPRRSILEAVRTIVDVDGFGAAFDKSIHHHSRSGFKKAEVLADYSFNLCPENDMYPGWFTEKIPESFHAGCFPIGWCDQSVANDFNPEAFLNLYDPSDNEFASKARVLRDANALEAYCDQPLLLTRPSLDPLFQFAKAILNSL